jgi:hypothetical protein
LREETAHPDQAHNSKVHPLKSRKNPTQKLHIKERISQARTAINYTSSFFSLDSGLKTFLTAPSHLPFFPMAPNSSPRRKNQSLTRKKQRPIRSAAQTKLPPRSIYPPTAWMPQREGKRTYTKEDAASLYCRRNHQKLQSSCRSEVMEIASSGAVAVRASSN